MNYLQIEFETMKEGESDILVALLTEAGFESFEEKENSLLAYIKEEDFIEAVLEDILHVIPVTYARTVTPQQNWNAQWESSFEPIMVNDFVAIRAGFHNAIQQVKYEIIITPKMSFGTGHHATTYMMMEQMEGIDFVNKSVVDFGTGTALLAILAEKMGASVIDAIDNDDWSIENAGENIATNNCFKIDIHKADTIASGKIYDIILANINLNVIQSNMQAINAAGKKGSKLLISGFLKSDEEVLLRSFSEYGIIHHKTCQKGEWISLLAEMN